MWACNELNKIKYHHFVVSVVRNDRINVGCQDSNKESSLTCSHHRSVVNVAKNDFEQFCSIH